MEHDSSEAPPGGSGSLSVHVVAPAPAPDAGGAPQDTFAHREVSCCSSTHFTTKVTDGTVILEANQCCGLFRDTLDVVAMRNVGYWEARTDHAGACSRSGSIKVHLSGGNYLIENAFKPAFINGRDDAFKADAVLRAASRQDRAPVPAFLQTPEMAAEQSWARKVGCCGSTGSCCTSCCCESVEHTTRVGPADSISFSTDKGTPMCCTRGLGVRGTTVDKVDLISAQVPVGVCAVVGDRPNFGDLACSCGEQASFAVDNDKDNRFDVNLNVGDAAAMTANVLKRMLDNPALGAEQTLRTYVSRHTCFGRKGELVVTNKRVTYTGFKWVPFCCEVLLPGVPNLCCAYFCQVHETTTIPLSKVTAVRAVGNGPCDVIAAASDLCMWAATMASSALIKGNLMALVVWVVVFAGAIVNIVFAPLIAIACWPWRQSSITIAGQVGQVGASLSPSDSGGLAPRDLAIEIVNVVRRAQETNAAAVRDTIAGSAK
jgi:hypothetical protein